MSLSRLVTVMMPFPGLLLLLTGIYATGGVHTTCRRIGEQVDCHMQTLRVFELLPVGSDDAHDVVDAYVYTTTSGSGPSSRARSSSNNTVVLETRDQELVSAYGAPKHGDHVFELRDFLHHPEVQSLHVFSSDWTFGLAAMAFGAVWTLVTRFIVVNTRDV